MSENPNLITIDNSALILIDQQPLVAFAVQSIDRSLLVNNVTGLAVAAEALGVPTVLTTVGAHGGPLSDPMFPRSARCSPNKRPSIVSRPTHGPTSSPQSKRPVGRS
jgi:nicotinamidase-related amidase